MDTPNDICKKYCSQRIQHLTDDKPCPFTLDESEIHMDGDDIVVHTICSGYLDTTFKTFIDRITRVTKKGVELVKELIKHKRHTSLDTPNDWGGLRIGKTQTPYTPPPSIPLVDPLIPNQFPWTYTSSTSDVKRSSMTYNKDGDDNGKI